MRYTALVLLCPAPALASSSALAASGQMLLSLLLVLALLGGVFVLLRRLQVRPGVSGGLRSLAALSVGTRERVVLLEVAGRQLLVGVAPGRVQTLLVLEPPAGEGAFARRLDEAIDRREVTS
ncbi:MAG TPA: flagellar biosynthesis protein FliO [Gammaproteobacteria bacterium]|jgi:flagellar protein FliO/FliZ|uniref:FliO/MopB family protein n=1 Tax=Immundisolibacter sp. TaxID=1934948 RepID=UPI000E9FCD87|nr:flagellar biosynthesis protein FliO [Gammaproteobacteria bacterium]MCH78047.1 flagellar biosynthesis protein FliO [Gammaproteobacteria bacterium]